MVAITDRNIRSNVFETVYDLLKGETYTSSVQPTVTAAYIDDEQSLPQVVIHPIMIDTDDYTFGQSLGSKEIRLIVDIYTKKTKDIDALSDDINYLIDTNLITGIQLIEVTEANNFEDINMNKIKMKTLAITYIRK